MTDAVDVGMLELAFNVPSDSTTTLEAVDIERDDVEEAWSDPLGKVAMGLLVAVIETPTGFVFAIADVVIP